MNKINIRTLKPEEIDIRVQSVNERGITLLLYKNARVDMAILDEVFGPTGWQRKHSLLGDSLYCTVSIRDENGEWIDKMDIGTHTFSDPEKGAASDSFKRASTCVGIGRELYTAPFIYIPADRVNIQNYNGKFIVKDKFYVQSIAHDERNSITGLTIINQRNEVVFQKMAEPEKTGKRPSAKRNVRKHIGKEQTAALRDLLFDNGISEDSVLSKHNLNSLEEMDSELFTKAMLALAKHSAA